jgi:hypothetical protein
MDLAKSLSRTFLYFAASGAGATFGISVVTLVGIAVGQKAFGLKATAEIVENEEKDEEAK